MREHGTATFTDLVDLAAAGLGGRVVGVSDDFFASGDNLLRAGRALFIEDKYTDRGKWMDGWESRRKREPGHDWCVIELGAPGVIQAFDIDTDHFLGNHPPFAAVAGLSAKRSTALSELQNGTWTDLLDQAPLRPGSHNLFTAHAAQALSHVRLSIFPDGGVARFRVFGKVVADWAHQPVDAETAPHVAPDDVDLAAVLNGATALACSDAFFGPMNNLLLPGRAENMGGGWETRRKRAPGHDWILIRLAARGVPRVIEVDTHHFKGNYPDRCALESIDAPGARITELVQASFRPLLPEVKLSAHARHFFRSELVTPAAATHVRLNVFPDGGVSRLRIWGTRA
ncbi:MAG TPA: allantoicase [Polyangiaceae bacterium]